MYELFQKFNRQRKNADIKNKQLKSQFASTLTLMYLLQFDWWLVLEKFILIAAIVTIRWSLRCIAHMLNVKIAAFMQDRIGPNRAGPFGIFQPLADGLKLFMKEEIIPIILPNFLFILGPMLAMITAMMTSAVIPWGSNH